MLSQFLIASAVFFQAVASENYYCDSGEAMCCSNITTVSTIYNPLTDSEEAHKHTNSQQASVVASRDILIPYSISESDLSGLVGIGCSVIAAAADVSDCVNETVCCTGPLYYVRPQRRFQEFALTFLDRMAKLL
jgi:hypothetical protein